ncbi:MAG: holo-ACP synthase [Sulfurimonas sp.]|nr:holo-ACP synthase [Sulfurimonas sp.]MDQ7061641.1 holo-ACP synthase [Sulfurimonas sp.]
MIGIDLIKTSRMDRLMQRFGEKALLRFLSPIEISLVKNYKTAAGFWAVKEAFSKALGTGIGKECNFHDIVICKTDKGAPYLRLEKNITDNYTIQSTGISITHDGEYAIAVATIEFS